MVDALEIAHSLLRPGAVLLNIQPIGRPRPLEIKSAAGTQAAGCVGHRLNHANQIQAREALQRVVERGLFAIEGEKTLPYLSHFDSPEHLNQWLKANSTRSYVEPAVLQRAQEMAAAVSGESEAMIRETLHMCRLRRLDAPSTAPGRTAAGSLAVDK